MYKPGQLITINNKIYRVTRMNDTHPCLCCPFLGTQEGFVCSKYCYGLINGTVKIPRNCYLKPIEDD